MFSKSSSSTTLYASRKCGLKRENFSTDLYAQVVLRLTAFFVAALPTSTPINLVVTLQEASRRSRANRRFSSLPTFTALRTAQISHYSGTTPAIAQCKIKGAFKFSSGRGAILVMENTKLTCIDPPGALRGLLKDTSMRGFVIVSEVHCCSSYARMLTTQEGTTVALGLSVEPPVSGAASVSAAATWVRNVSSGNFRSQVNKKGERKFYPLFRLVSLTEKATSTGLRGDSGEDTVASLPDAEPPWDAHLKIAQKPAKSKK
ncbi:hypothetical protein K438DRAFT_1971949 [Mycena galopus ATCC 62051]|nr:hypothetical protein K438DRAFT_1971949 [Mycena galopus ATCC 62051]